MGWSEKVRIKKMWGEWPNLAVDDVVMSGRDGAERKGEGVSKSNNS